MPTVNDDWIRKIEQGFAYESRKVTDGELRQASSKWNKKNEKRQKYYKKRFGTIFYRDDADLLLPAAGGRVGGLCNLPKKWKMQKGQLKRTKNTCPPIHDRVDWNPRFSYDDRFHLFHEDEEKYIETYNIIGERTMDAGNTERMDRAYETEYQQRKKTHNSLIEDEIDEAEEYIRQFRDTGTQDGKGLPFLMRPAKQTRKKISLADFEELSAAGLSDLLDTMGLQHYSENIFQSGISGKIMIEANEFELVQMGITYEKHRKKLIKFLDKLRVTDTTIEGLNTTLFTAKLTTPYRKNPKKDDTWRQFVFEKDEKMRKTREMEEREHSDEEEEDDVDGGHHKPFRKSTCAHYKSAKDAINAFKIRNDQETKDDEKFQEKANASFKERVTMNKVAAANAKSIRLQRADKLFKQRQIVQEDKLLNRLGAMHFLETGQSRE